MVLHGLTILIWGVAFGFTLWGTWYALRQFSRAQRPKTKRSEANSLPPITILKPLKGNDPGLHDNLLSFFSLNYPDFRVVFCLECETDPAVSLVRELLIQQGDQRFSLQIGAKEIGPNPKINNLILAYEAAATDWILISDSNVRVPSDYLSQLVLEVSPDVGVLTSVVAGTQPRGCGGRLEATYLNTFYARWMHITAALGSPCVVGKSMLFRKSLLARVGGLSVLGRYINEDYIAGLALRRLGYRVKIVRDPIAQFIGEHSLQSFWSRHVRWGRIRKCQAPLAFVFEPLITSLCSGLIGAYGVAPLFGISGLSFFLLHCLAWMACDAILARRLGHRSDGPAVLTWCLRELLSFPLWLQVACGNTVRWRGRSLRLSQGGLVTV